MKGSVLIVMLLGSSFAFADPALRYERASNRVERRDVRAGGRIENRQERSGGRIENRQERSGARIENRQERRDMLFSPPAGATAVSVGGVQGFRVGADVYTPAIYEGETVYVKANGE